MFPFKSLFSNKRLVQCQLFYIRAVDALPTQFLLLIDSSLLIQRTVKPISVILNLPPMDGLGVTRDVLNKDTNRRRNYT